MKKTKDIILETALRLFNQQGLAKVTLRAIAKEMGISQGNLNYHYKKREDIIEALYFQLVGNIDESFVLAERMQSATSSALPAVLAIAETTILNFYDYRFIMIDFVQIIREHEPIRQHFHQLTAQREQQFLLLIQLLIAQGILREALLDNEYAHLLKRTQIIGNYWISHFISTNDDELSKEDMRLYAEVLNQNIFAYLTEKGREEYHNYTSLFAR